MKALRTYLVKIYYIGYPIEGLVGSKDNCIKAAPIKLFIAAPFGPCGHQKIGIQCYYKRELQYSLRTDHFEKE